MGIPSSPQVQHRPSSISVSSLASLVSPSDSNERKFTNSASPQSSSDNNTPNDSSISTTNSQTMPPPTKLKSENNRYNTPSPSFGKRQMSTTSITSNNNTDDQTQTNKEQQQQQPRKRKRKLIGPPFVCTFPGCGKEFHRSEHLSRHQLNHNPKKIYKCSQPSCEKTFVRHDLLVRHMKRHETKAMKQQLKQQEARERTLSAAASETAHTNGGLQNKSQALQEREAQALLADTELVSSLVSKEKSAPNKDHLSSVNQIIQQHHHIRPSNNTLDDFGKDFTPDFMNWLFNDQRQAQDLLDPNGGLSVNNNVSTSNANGDFFSDWTLNNLGTQSFFIPDGFEDFSPMSTSGSMYSQNQESPASGPNAAVSNVRSDSNHSNNGSFSSTIFDIHIYQLSDAQLDKFDELIPVFPSEIPHLTQTFF
ncbi:unnamed protein product [Ambrosiozyma monospora]|uniref:Unnamed protein product n=1 Tax=Ambrosiozyma monospora TaxID=43982 RepID=A0ACB5T6B4_AMBMO|nr:unnamed protein product [Ambrosiozyma monospora]